MWRRSHADQHQECQKVELDPRYCSGTVVPPLCRCPRQLWRASIQSALLLNGGASIALLAFLGNLAIAQQTKGLAGSFSTLKESFVCFGVGVTLAAGSNVVAFLIQIFSIAHPEDAEGRTGRQLRFVGIGMVVTSLLLFAADQRGGKRVEQCDRIVGCDHSTVT